MLPDWNRSILGASDGSSHGALSVAGWRLQVKQTAEAELLGASAPSRHNINNVYNLLYIIHIISSFLYIMQIQMEFRTDGIY